MTDRQTVNRNSASQTSAYLISLSEFKYYDFCAHKFLPYSVPVQCAMNFAHRLYNKKNQ